MDVWKYFARFFGSYYTLFIVLTVNLSVFVNGMTMAWTSPVLVKLSSSEDNPLGKPLNGQQVELIGSLLFVAAAFGPLVFLRSSEILGRKQTLALSLVPSLLGYAILVFAKKVELYYIARILNGLSVGPICGLSQTYLSEIILSVRKRGSYLAINSPSIQSGFLVSYVVGPYVPVVVFNGLIFSFTFLVTILIIFGCPESPIFVLKSKGRKASSNILKSLGAVDVEKELMQIEKDMNRETQTSIFAVFKSKENIKPFIMATTLLILQQFSGIYILMAYSQQIFLKSEGILPSEQCSIIVGVLQVLSATATTVTSRKFTRKSLLTISLLGSGVFDFILGLYFYFADYLSGYNWIPLASLISFVIFYNAGLDPIPWVYLGEIFPSQLKSVGTSASIIVFWIFFSVSSFAFTKIHASYMFLFYSVSCFVGVFYVIIGLTETKDKTFGEIQEELKKGSVGKSAEWGSQKGKF